MNPPKAVVFDLGKVLLDFDYSIAVNKLLPSCTASMETIREILSGSRLHLDYECGLMSSQEFFEKLRKLTGYTGTFEAFEDAFGPIFSAIEPMVDLHQRLKKADVPLCVFSNTNEIAIHHVRIRFPFFNTFDRFVLSYEHRAMKPDAELYEEVENELGMVGSDLLYYDDRPENIQTGIARGWRTVLHETPEASIAAARSAGLPV